MDAHHSSPLTRIDELHAYPTGGNRPASGGRSRRRGRNGRCRRVLITRCRASSRTERQKYGQAKRPLDAAVLWRGQHNDRGSLRRDCKANAVRPSSLGVLTSPLRRFRCPGRAHGLVRTRLTSLTDTTRRSPFPTAQVACAEIRTSLEAHGVAKRRPWMPPCSSTPSCGKRRCSSRSSQRRPGGERRLRTWPTRFSSIRIPFPSRHRLYLRRLTGNSRRPPFLRPRKRS